MQERICKAIRLGLTHERAAQFSGITDRTFYTLRAKGAKARYFASCDYGTGNPTVFGLFGYGPKKPARLLKEYHWDSVLRGRLKTDSEYSDDYLKFVGTEIRPGTLYVDPSAANFIAELRKRGEDKPVKQHDHCMDMVRYGLFTHFFREYPGKLVGFNYD